MFKDLKSKQDYKQFIKQLISTDRSDEDILKLIDNLKNLADSDFIEIINCCFSTF